jgi:succinyl-CoA synthetase beta subunit
VPHITGVPTLILVGIIRCDMIAESIIAAADELGPLRVPIVVRLQGTNSAQGQQMVSKIQSRSDIAT